MVTDGYDESNGGAGTVFYCGCHSITFRNDAGVCPSCQDEWEEVDPDQNQDGEGEGNV